MATDPATGGYWLVASDGGIFSFGAPFFGSTGAIHLNKPIVGMEASANGQGYRFEAVRRRRLLLRASPLPGSMGGQPLAAPVVGMAADNATNGYWLAARRRRDLQLRRRQLPRSGGQHAALGSAGLRKSIT